MKKFITKTIALFALTAVFSCASDKSMIDRAYYSQRSPKLDLQRYFDGNIEGYGLVQDKQGRIVKTFSVKVKGEWEENKGIVKEYFVFDNNKKDSAVWIVTVNQDGSISAIAHDIVGSIKGGQYGSAAEWTYVSSKKVNGIEVKTKVNDTFFAINNESLVRISYSEDMKTTTFYKKLGGRVQAQDVSEPKVVAQQPVAAVVPQEVAKPVIVPEAPKAASVPTAPISLN